MPLGVESFRLYGRPTGSVISHACLRPGSGASGDAFIGDIHLFGTSGEMLAEVKGLLMRGTDREALQRFTREPIDGWLYEVAWREQPNDGRASGGLRDELPAPSASRRSCGRGWRLPPRSPASRTSDASVRKWSD